MVRAWAIGPGNDHWAGEVDERCVEPEDDFVLMVGFESDRIVFFDRGLDASSIFGMGQFRSSRSAKLEDIV